MKLTYAIFWLLLPAIWLHAGITPPDIALTEREQQIVAAAKLDEHAAPRFNGGMIVGVHPNTPLIYALSVSGERPISFEAKNFLPDSAGCAERFDQRFTEQAGEFIDSVARQKTPSAKRRRKLKSLSATRSRSRRRWAGTVTMHFGDAVTEAEVLANAAWLKEHLQPLGWDTVVVDFRWYDSKADGIRVQNPEGVTIDAIWPVHSADESFSLRRRRRTASTRSPTRLHAMGLKFGIHIMRGIPRGLLRQNPPIAGSEFKAAQAVLPEGDIEPHLRLEPRHVRRGRRRPTAGKAWYASIAQQYASWGVDYIKCDDIADMFRGRFYAATKSKRCPPRCGQTDHSIVLSLSPGPSPVMHEHLETIRQPMAHLGGFLGQLAIVEPQFRSVRRMVRQRRARPLAGRRHDSVRPHLPAQLRRAS